ncbi:sugar phosphate isomerase/epimerase family protein [Glycomyces buryatensis]|uniref:Sugar phosphate isomerase/epimerase n=1 Tax=Glycomyces buryatensis TaxID=2570927 RepID=A0A4S8QEZ0_9ACTN|nr:TIM barrel protein [Glycomyces buryatensis]THV42241.1 sugar phosphate isomerase/epimerase [Glycomyces buryatensis]
MGDLTEAEPGTAPSIGLVSWRSPAVGTAFLDLASRTGVAGVQLDFGGPGRAPWLDQPRHLELLRRRSVETGIALLAVAGNALNDIGLAAPVRSAAAAEVERLVVRMLDAAAALGCPLVFLPSFRRSAIEDSEALHRTAQVLSWAAAEASARRLLLANENTLGPGRALELVERVAAPNFRLVLDNYNLASAGVDPAGIIADLAPYLADQVHLKDGPAGVNTAPLGSGDGHLESTMDALARERLDVRFLLLENDYRDGDDARLSADIAWARNQAERLRQPIGSADERRDTVS